MEENDSRRERVYGKLRELAREIESSVSSGAAGFSEVNGWTGRMSVLARDMAEAEMDEAKEKTFV